VPPGGATAKKEALFAPIETNTETPTLTPEEVSNRHLLSFLTVNIRHLAKKRISPVPGLLV
jgi:hypothetical protein